MAAINGSGNAGNDTIVGNDAVNDLSGGGGDGDDVLMGGGALDSLRGGNGNDIYVIDADTEIDKTSADVGTDMVAAGISYTLGANQENRILIGPNAINGNGSGGNKVLTSNDVANLLDGGNGDDLIDGGVGVDQLRGGAGIDVLDLRDGFDDVVLGAKYSNYQTGGVYVLFGSATPFAPVIDLASLNGGNGFHIEGAAQHDSVGISVSGAGDVDGDGFDDLLIGAPAAGEFVGASYVVFGHGGAFGSSLSLATIDGSNGFRVDGLPGLYQSGRTVNGAGDVNGDGFDDFLIDAPDAAGQADSGGVSLLVYDRGTPFEPLMSLSSIDGHTGIRFDASTARFNGYDLAAGDFNGDGHGDLLVGAPNTPVNGKFGAGVGYVLFDHAGGFGASIDLNTLNGSNGFAIGASAPSNQLGWSVASAGDRNGDGYDDILVAATGSNGGAILDEKTYVLCGHADGFSGSITLDHLGNTAGLRIDDLPGDNYFGPDLGLGGDINGDCFDDIVVGATFATTNGPESGATFVI